MKKLILAVVMTLVASFAFAADAVKPVATKAAVTKPVLAQASSAKKVKKVKKAKKVEKKTVAPVVTPAIAK